MYIFYVPIRRHYVTYIFKDTWQCNHYYTFVSLEVGLSSSATKANKHIYFTIASSVIPGTYQGQWMRGLRHGYGVRTSAPFGLASHYRGGHRDHRGSQQSLAEAGTPDPAERRTTRMDEARGGFVLKASSDEPSGRRGSLAERTKKGLLSVSLNIHICCGFMCIGHGGLKGADRCRKAIFLTK